MCTCLAVLYCIVFLGVGLKSWAKHSLVLSMHRNNTQNNKILLLFTQRICCTPYCDLFSWVSDIEQASATQ